VEETLEELGAADKPVVVALNKIDLLPDPGRIQEMLKGFRNSIAISAKEGMGLDELLSRISLVLGDRLDRYRV
jgi:GTP-binding protein HflX